MRKKQGKMENVKDDSSWMPWILYHTDPFLLITKCHFFMKRGRKNTKQHLYKVPFVAIVHLSSLFQFRYVMNIPLVIHVVSV